MYTYMCCYGDILARSMMFRQRLPNFTTIGFLLVSSNITLTQILNFQMLDRVQCISNSNTLSGFTNELYSHQPTGVDSCRQFNIHLLTNQSLDSILPGIVPG